MFQRGRYPGSAAATDQYNRTGQKPVVRIRGTVPRRPKGE